jgi:hypothetical protein
MMMGGPVVDPSLGVGEGSLPPEYLQSAGAIPPVLYNYARPDVVDPDQGGTAKMPTLPYSVASNEEIEANPWMADYQVTGVLGLEDPKKWGPEHVTNFYNPEGLYPVLRRGPNVPLYQEPLDAEAINPTKRAITTRELRGNSFHAQRKTPYDFIHADYQREWIEPLSIAGAYGCKNQQHPGDVYTMPPAPDSDFAKNAALGVAPQGVVTFRPHGLPNSGWAGGLQMTQRTTNKHTGRVQILRTHDPEMVTFASDAPRHNTRIGKVLDSMHADPGTVRLPRNMGVDEYHKAPVRTTGPGGYKASHPFRPDAFTQQTRNHKNMQAATALPGAPPVSHRFSTIDRDHGMVRRTFRDVTDQAQGWYFGPMLNNRGAAGVEASMCPAAPDMSPCSGSVPGDSSLACTAGAVVSEGGGAASTVHASKAGSILMPDFCPGSCASAEAGASAGMGASMMMPSAPVSRDCFGGDRANDSTPRPTNRTVANLIGDDRTETPYQTRVVHNVGLTHGAFIQPNVDHHKTPLIHQDLDPVFISGFLNNPYRNVPIGDGKGGWISAKPAAQDATQPGVFYTGDMSQLQ